MVHIFGGYHANGYRRHERLATTKYCYDNEMWIDYIDWFIVRPDGENVVYYFSNDNVGNIEEINSVEICIDIEAPATTYDLSGIMSDNGWFMSDVLVMLSATDTASGVSYTEYSIDGGRTWLTYVEPFYIVTKGVSKLTYLSVDKAGNVEQDTTIIIRVSKKLH